MTTFLRRAAWTCWLLVPILLLAYHYGPGQARLKAQRAAGVLQLVSQLESDAAAKQGLASTANAAAAQARKAAKASLRQEDIEAARAAEAQESAAYVASEGAWKSVADTIAQAQALLSAPGSPDSVQLRIQRDRALVRAGQLNDAIPDLERLLEDGAAPTATTQLIREELATAYYFSAHVLRSSGASDEEWQEAADLARQQFRHLAESQQGDQQLRQRKNLEAVLNFQQSTPEFLEGEGVPVDCPKCKGKLPPEWWQRKKKGSGDDQKQPRDPKDKDARNQATSPTDGFNGGH